MHPTNYTLYQLIRYHIELTEAMEYTLITYKYEEKELIERFLFLKMEYKKGFFHHIISKLYKNNKYLTSELRDYLTSYNKETIEAITKDHDLHSRIKHNQKLYLACSTTSELIEIFLNEQRINEVADKELIKIFEIANKHFNLFFLFNSLNLFVSTKVIILNDDLLYTLQEEDKQLLLLLLTSLEINKDKSLLEESINLICGKTKFNEENAYDLLNKVSIECIESEKDLYSNFEAFSNKLEKEIENNHN